MIDLIGKNIDGFRINSILGEGGMGIVYKATDTKLERNVAIKMMHPRTGNSSNVFTQFRKEAKHHAKLIHTNIVTVYGMLEYYSYLGIIMEYVDGVNLGEMIYRNGRLNYLQTLKILKQLLAGIDHAHKKGFIHRDIKPSNILIDNNGNVKIMDFGISKSLFDSAGFDTPFSKMGTVYYMSPEQIKGEKATALSDIYATGCTAYEMLTGNPPFNYANEFDVMEGHLKKLPLPFSNLIYGIPEWFESIIFKTLEKNTRNRYFDCGQILDDINRNSTTAQQPIIIQVQDRKIKPTNYEVRSKNIVRALTILILLIILIVMAYIVVKFFPVSSNTQLKDDPKRMKTMDQYIK